MDGFLSVGVLNHLPPKPDDFTLFGEGNELEYLQTANGISRGPDHIIPTGLPPGTYDSFSQYSAAIQSYNRTMTTNESNHSKVHS